MRNNYTTGAPARQEFSENFPNGEPLTVGNKGAARLLGISQSHLFAMKRAGKLGPTPVRLGRCCRYRVQELRAWLDAGCPARSRWAAMNGGVA
jgi:predicted DNA-binding transcriptional regulator AlpA